VVLNWNVHIGAINQINIGNNVLIGSHVLITDHMHGTLSKDDMLVVPVRRRLNSRGGVIIEDDVWIGEGVAVLPGVHIGRGAIIGANAVVVSDVAPETIVGGVPARLIRHLV